MKVAGCLEISWERVVIAFCASIRQKKDLSDYFFRGLDLLSVFLELVLLGVLGLAGSVGSVDWPGCVGPSLCEAVKVPWDKVFWFAKATASVPSFSYSRIFSIASLSFTESSATLISFLWARSSVLLSKKCNIQRLSVSQVERARYSQ